ncbi:MAG: histidine phosphatase family protein, partial [Clostridia bacterium]
VLAQIAQMRAGSDALLAAHGFVREGACYRCHHPTPARIAVFCHQGLQTTWLAHLLNLPILAAWAGLFQACTSVTTLVMEQYGGPFATPRMIAMGDTAHLRLAGMEPSLAGLRVQE